MLRNASLALVLVAVLAPSAELRSNEPTVLVVCAPGFPSNTEQAQPTMDALAGAVARGAGWAPGRVAAVYHPDLDGGLAALNDERAALTLVPLPFYLEYRQRLGLQPILQVDQEPEAWSLVAGAGAVASAQALAGWEIAGIPAYSPRFVRRILLADWGNPPDDTQIVFHSRVVSVLRKAAAGDPVAAVLDRAQAEALPALPFADQLEVVTRSRPVPGTLLCRVGDRQPEAETRAATRAFLGLREMQGGPELLETLRIPGFREVDGEELSRIENVFDPDEDRER